MFRFKVVLRNELLEGKTTTYIAKITGYSRVYISYVLNGRQNIEKSTVENILLPIIKTSMKLSEDLKEYGLENVIKHFFVEV